MKKIRLGFLICLLLLVSCFASSVQAFRLQPSSSSETAARVLVYLHLKSTIFDDIQFVISEASLMDDSGIYHEIASRPISVSSDDVGLAQVLLSEGFVPPGQYVELRLVFSEASIVSHGKKASLRLPDDGVDFTAKISLELAGAESTVISLEWDPSRAIEKKVVFAPVLVVEAQRPSAQGLLLFVSNSGSNYVTVIDRSLERVVGAVTVGEAPMGMAFNQTKDMLYVLNSRTQNISVVDVLYLELRDTIELTAGMGPTDMVFMPDDTDIIEGKLYVVNKLSNDVITVDTSSSRVMKTIPVGNGPSFILADTDRREVYVTNEYSNTLSIVNTVDDLVVETIKVDDNPSGLALGTDEVYVFNENSNTISVVSQSDRDISDTLIVSEPPKRGLKAFDDRFFVLNTRASKMTFFNRYDVMTAIREVGDGPVCLVADEDRNRIYVSNFNSNTVSIVDPKGEKVVGELVVGSKPYGVLLLDK